MKRVSMEAAKRPGSVTLSNMPKFVGTDYQVTSQMMTYNRQWILQQMRSGRPLIDIGLDPLLAVVCNKITLLAHRNVFRYVEREASVRACSKAKILLHLQ